MLIPLESLKFSGLINTMQIADASNVIFFLRKTNHGPPIRRPIQLIIHEYGLRNIGAYRKNNFSGFPAGVMIA
jgi:hypothetical protein